MPPPREPAIMPPKRGARRALASAEPLLNISYVWKRFCFFDSFPPAHPTCISDPYKLSPARKSHRDAPHELDVTSRDPISIRFPSLLNPPRSANTDLSKPSTRPPCLISAPHACKVAEIEHTARMDRGLNHTDQLLPFLWVYFLF